MNEEKKIDNQNNHAVKSEGQHLIENNHFERMLAIQEKIYQATQVKPSIRKLINLTLSKANYQEIKEELIDQYR